MIVRRICLLRAGRTSSDDHIGLLRKAQSSNVSWLLRTVAGLAAAQLDGSAAAI